MRHNRGGLIRATISRNVQLDTYAGHVAAIASTLNVWQCKANWPDENWNLTQTVISYIVLHNSYCINIYILNSITNLCEIPKFLFCVCREAVGGGCSH